MDKVTRPCPQTTTFLKRRRAEAVSNQGPSTYQPNALPLGQTSSQPWLNVLSPLLSPWLYSPLYYLPDWTYSPLFYLPDWSYSPSFISLTVLSPLLSPWLIVLSPLLSPWLTVLSPLLSPWLYSPLFHFPNNHSLLSFITLTNCTILLFYLPDQLYSPLFYLPPFSSGVMK